MVYDGNNLGHQKLLEQHTLKLKVVSIRARLRRRAEAPVNARAMMNKHDTANSTSGGLAIALILALLT
jgi:hypothetical protein